MRTNDGPSKIKTTKRFESSFWAEMKMKFILQFDKAIKHGFFPLKNGVFNLFDVFLPFNTVHYFLCVIIHELEWDWHSMLFHLIIYKNESFGRPNTASYVLCRCHREFVVVLHLRNGLQVTVWELLLLLVLPDTDFPMRPIRICATFFDSTNCNYKIYKLFNFALHQIYFFESFIVTFVQRWLFLCSWICGKCRCMCRFSWKLRRILVLHQPTRFASCDDPIACAPRWSVAFRRFQILENKKKIIQRNQ